MTPLLSIYLALTRVAARAAPALLRWRRARGKEDPRRWPERIGNASLPRPAGPLVWFHGASVGESMSVLPLIERVGRARPDVSFLVTSGTVNSASLLARRLPENAQHQYAPLDIEPAVSRFLDHWRPDIAVCVESEIWPRLLRSVGERDIPALLLNARMSERSQARWGRFPKTAAKVFSVFDYVQAQDATTGRALAGLGVRAERLVVASSFKEAAPPLPCDPGELELMRAAIRGRRVWVAASTHRGEEELAADAHRHISALHRDALLIIVPRHPERRDDIMAQLGSSGLTWVRRDEGPPPPGASVYLADTFGELGLWYRIADVAFVGGSTRGIGGHNPFEPIVLGVPVLHGPDTGNFSAIYRQLDAADAARLVRSADELAGAVLDLAATPAADAMARRAGGIAGSGTEALDRAVGAIADRLPAVCAPELRPAGK